MEWFYASGKEQKGPVFASELRTLRDSGEVTDDTLVWRDGMMDWISFREAGIAAASTMDQTPAGSETGEEMAVCAHSGKSMPKSMMVAYGSRFVAPEHKEAFVQRLREGAPVNDPAELMPDDYTVDIGSCLGRAWRLLSSNFWPIIGITFLINLINGVGQQFYIGSFVLVVPLMAGLQYYFLLQIRGHPATIDDSFAGFRRNFGQLALMNVVAAFIVLGCFIPGFVVMFLGIGMVEAAGDNMGETAGLLAVGATMGGLGLMCLPMAYLMVSWMFAGLLCIDRLIPFWPAMKISMKTAHKHLFWCLLFGAVIWLISMLGFLALCVGALVTSPFAMIAATYLYEDIYGNSRGSGSEI